MKGGKTTENYEKFSLYFFSFSFFTVDDDVVEN